MKVWQVQFPDNKVQVASDGVTQEMATQVMVDFMAEFVKESIELVTITPDVPVGFASEIEDDADVSQQVEESG